MTKGITALGLDRDLGFSQGNQGYWPLDDDHKEEEDDEVEDNYKDRCGRQNIKKSNKEQGASVIMFFELVKLGPPDLHGSRFIWYPKSCIINDDEDEHGNNLANFQARTSKFLMVIDLDSNGS